MVGIAVTTYATCHHTYQSEARAQTRAIPMTRMVTATRVDIGRRRIAFLAPDSAAILLIWALTYTIPFAYASPLDGSVRSPGRLSREVFLQSAEELDLDMGIFLSCLDEGGHEERVLADVEAGRAMNVFGTPTVFVDGRVVSAGESGSGSPHRSADAPAGGAGSSRPNAAARPCGASARRCPDARTRPWTATPATIARARTRGADRWR